MENIPYSEFRGRKVPGTILHLHGALAGHSDVDFETFLLAVGEVDRAFRRSHYAQNIELPTEVRFAKLVDHLRIDDPELPGILSEVHMGCLREHVREVEHHPQVLADLRGRVSVGLCSNFSHSPTALSILDAASLNGHLDAIVISDAIGIRKPRREIFDAALEALGVAPEGALHVGDSLPADVAGASAAGIRTVWLTRRVKEPAKILGEYEGPQPDWQIEDLSEIDAVLDEAGLRA
jgi:FMN phosphatase YigB (HAD superfamily)